MRHADGYVVIAQAPPRRVAGQAVRASWDTPRRKLSPEQEAAILALAGTKSLRSLSAEFGVSHETVRGVVRATKADVSR